MGVSVKTTTPSKIIEVARIKTDTVYSTHTSDAEALILVNRAYLDLYNLMITVDEALFISEATLTLVDGVAQLPDDLFKLSSVYSTANGFDVVFERRSLQDRSGSVVTPHNRAWGTYSFRNNTLVFTPKSPQGPVKILYIPLPTELTSLTDNITLMANEDSYLISTLCRDFIQREEGDKKPWEAQMGYDLAKIKAQLAPRDNGSNPVVRDVTDYQKITSVHPFGRGW
jgi:hypothetical protein